MELNDGKTKTNSGGARIQTQPNYYEIMNVSYGASKSLIRESFIRLKSTFSTHNNAFYSLVSEQEAQEMMVKIEEAFRVLNDDVKRRSYDQSIGVESDLIRPGFGQINSGERHRDFSEEKNPGIAHKGSMSNSEELPRLIVEKHSVTAVPVQKKTNEDSKKKIAELIETHGLGSGKLCKAIRELLQVSVEEIQDRTKVGIDYIEAIESENFSYLPQLVFVKGFLRSYLRYLAVPRLEDMVKAFAQRQEEWTNRGQEAI
jgi:hypothetical protein